MLTKIHSNRKANLTIALGLGVVFGFLLQKGGVTRFDVIIGQLLLKDWTVVKIMLSAVITGTIGVHILKDMGLVMLHPKHGSIGMTVVGGLIFGVGFATLGYCPGTIAGAVGQGSLDALLGGVPGILLGAWIYALIFPALNRRILKFGDFKDVTLPRLFNVNEWIVVIPAAIMMTALLYWLESSGL